MFRAELQRYFSVLFPLRPPRRLVPSCLALYWMERQDLGQGAFLFLISVKFSFWKGRSGKGHVCSAMVGGRHGEKPPGGVRVAASRAHRPLKKLLVLPPSALSPCCFPFPFFKAWRPRQPSLPPAVLLRWRSAGWGSHLPSSCPRMHIPTCSQPWAALPASPPPSHQPWHEGRSFLGSG